MQNSLLLVFRVTTFRINQHNNQNRSKDKVKKRKKVTMQILSPKIQVKANFLMEKTFYPNL